MNAVYPDAGLTVILLRAITQEMTWRLYVNDYTPDKDAIPANFTEAAWTGYLPVVLGLGDVIESGAIGHVGYMLFSPISFLNGSAGPVTAWGYYVTNEDATIVFQAFRFDPPVVRQPTESFLITPGFGNFSEYG